MGRAPIQWVQDWTCRRVNDSRCLAQTNSTAQMASPRITIAQPGPALVEFLIEQEAHVFPMIPPGASLSEPIEGEPASPRLVPA